ncbi:procyclic form surface glycoprotein [Trypanosoma rangeli]|uniref:Procyclic form surface glycoprotein n=1 Tax=Trypanosoma rangeli TaxID=5698 RepID=A0A3R7LZZ1_TRYRA|nr:procyclic form surface glycoprotein [Trypanosoma rangeli]RNF06545.1 procyclic form surface glycoprotein [Trypanosoma rangeli]|eukprot:RNF06545.1 procyclic form surface glycoprotein [Trypanosoma rangeli]
MCFDILGAVENLYKTVVAFACCLIIGGPALIIAGGILLNKGDGKKAFTEAVKEFDPTFINTWAGNINDAPITVRRESLNVEGVTGATSVFAEATIPVGNSRSSGMLSISVNVFNVTPFNRGAIFQITRKLNFDCSSTSCGAGKSCHCDTEARNFQDKCSAMNGRLDAYPKWCRSGHKCGQCTVTLYLSRVYLVVQEVSKGKYAEDTTLQSAKYPFHATDNDYKPNVPSTVAVRLYSNKDPYIALQRETQGTGEFGPNPRTVGIVLIVLGVLFLLLEVCVATAIICYCMRRNKTTSDAPPNFSADNYQTSGVGGVDHNMPSQSPPPPQGYTYGQPPPPQGYTYGQPPPPQGYTYGQPPPPQGYTYGQPPPPQGYTYGQPPPPQGYTYGQPPPPQGYTYGQPPPPQGYKYN